MLIFNFAFVGWFSVPWYLLHYLDLRKIQHPWIAWTGYFIVSANGDHCGSRVEGISKYLELARWNGEWTRNLGWWWESLQEGENLGHEEFVQFQGSGTWDGREDIGKWSTAVLEMRLGNWNWRIGRRVNINYLVTWSLWSADFQGEGVSGWAKRFKWERKTIGEYVYHPENEAREEGLDAKLCLLQI